MEKCTWKPELHNGEECPFHKGKYKNYNDLIRKGYENNEILYSLFKNLMTGHKGENLNKKLRNNEKLNKDEDFLYNNIKDSLYSIGEPINLYRTDNKDIWNAKIGDIINQKEFLYTSSDANTTKAEDRNNFKVFTHLITNKNTKLIATNYANENEVVLEDNLNYQIIGKSVQNIKERKVICYTILIK